MQMFETFLWSQKEASLKPKKVRASRKPTTMMMMRRVLGCRRRRHRRVAAPVLRLLPGAAVALLLPLLLLLFLLLSCHLQLVQHSSNNFAWCDAFVVAPTTRPHWQSRSRNSAFWLFSTPAAVVAQRKNNTDLVGGAAAGAAAGRDDLPLDSFPVLQEQQAALTGQDDETDDGDAFFRRVRREWPVPLQYWLRDSGALRFLVNVGSLVGARTTILQDHPDEALPEYWRLSGLPPQLLLPFWRRHSFRSRRRLLKQQQQPPAISLETLSYGPSKQQTIHLLRQREKTPTAAAASKQHTNARRRLVVFVHGGAWGSGFPALYRLVARPFLKKDGEPTAVAVVGYRTYPTATALEQAQDAADAVRRVLRHQEEPQQDGAATTGKQVMDVTLIGHSSGAHVCALALLRGLFSAANGGGTQVDRFVGIAGVYDVPSHYRHERGRGVERISPMSQACRDPNSGGSAAAAAATTGSSSVLHQWRQHSPTWMVQKQKHLPQPPWHPLPPTLLLHGEADTTVPYQSSRDLARALSATNDGGAAAAAADCELRILPGVQHAETALHLMFGGPTRDQLLEWMEG